MRQVKLTAKPARARSGTRVLGAVGALLMGSLAASPAHAWQITPPDPATKAAMEKRTAARALLSSSLARIASNSNDTAALLDAGRASIALEDYRAALGFLVRAEQASPRDGAVKAALGSAMVHMENPTRALDYFGEAQLMGASERLFLADRGLARDLLGQQDAAQRDYQLALTITPGDELTRRYALSLGISGDADRAIAMLTPQLRAQDRGAWRLRAMILAMNGRDKEATDIVNATMPPAMAQNILPYLTQMDRLNPAQQAAAAHFGRFPNGQLGPKRKPIQVAAATPPPAPAAAAPARRPVAAQGGKREPVAAAPVAATPKPQAVAAKPSPRPASASPAASAVSAPPNPPPATGGARVMPTPENPFPTVESPRVFPTPENPFPAGGGAGPTFVPATASAPASSPTPAPVSAAPASPGVTGPRPSDSVGPGFSIADVGRGPTDPASAGTSAQPPTPVAAAPGSPVSAAPAPAPLSAAAAAPLASLADIVGSIEIPASELDRPANAIGADTLAKLLDDKRKAEAAEAAKREKDEAAAKAKAEADAKAKAEAAEKKAHPARIWVQIATGSNAKALGLDFGKFSKKHADLFKGKSGGIAEWGQTRRLLVGPFKDRKAAQDWLGSYKKAGGDAFLFNSEAGETVDPVK